MEGRRRVGASPLSLRAAQGPRRAPLPVPGPCAGPSPGLAERVGPAVGRAGLRGLGWRCRSGGGQRGPAQELFLAGPSGKRAPTQPAARGAPWGLNLRRAWVACAARGASTPPAPEWALRPFSSQAAPSAGGGGAVARPRVGRLEKVCGSSPHRTVQKCFLPCPVPPSPSPKYWAWMFPLLLLGVDAACSESAAGIHFLGLPQGGVAGAFPSSWASPVTSPCPSSGASWGTITRLPYRAAVPAS